MDEIRRRSGFPRLVPLHDQTERVTHGVQEHSESLPGLVVGFSSTDAEDVTFSLVEIIDFKVEMHLFRRGPFGPGGRHVVLYSLKTQSRKGIVHQVDVWRIFRGVTRPTLYRNASEGRVKRCECEGVGTVKQDKVQSWKFHAATLCRASICPPTADSPLGGSASRLTDVNPRSTKTVPISFNAELLNSNDSKSEEFSVMIRLSSYV